MKKTILIVGYQNYSQTVGNANAGSEYPIKINRIAFVPRKINEEIDGFRRIISLIYKEDAKNKIDEWIKYKKTGRDVANEVFIDKKVILVNIMDDQKDQESTIRTWIKNNENDVKVLVIGAEAYKRIYYFLEGQLGKDNVVAYPNPIERSADDIYWRNIDYKEIQKKYDNEEDVIKFFN